MTARPAPNAPTPDLRDQGSKARALVVLLIGACAIGFAPILVRLTETGPAAAAFWRLLFALPLLALLAARPGAGPGSLSRWTALAGLLFVLDLGVWHYGIALTSVANATVLSNLTPVVVTAAAWLLFKERPTRLFLAALVLALAGAGMIAAAQAGGRGTNPPLGDALSTLTALFYGGYILAVRQARASSSAARLMVWATVVGLPIVAVQMLALREDLTPETLLGWGACMALGLMHVTGQGSIAWALGRLPASTTSLVVLVQPVVAAALGWAIFGERITALQALGGAVALTGVVLAQASALRARPGPA